MTRFEQDLLIEYLKKHKDRFIYNYKHRTEPICHFSILVNKQSIVHAMLGSIEAVSVFHLEEDPFFDSKESVLFRIDPVLLDEKEEETLFYFQTTSII